MHWFDVSVKWSSNCSDLSLTWPDSDSTHRSGQDSWSADQVRVENFEVTQSADQFRSVMWLYCLSTAALDLQCFCNAQYPV